MVQQRFGRVVATIVRANAFALRPFIQYNALMRQRFEKSLNTFMDKGCAIMTILLVTLPLWVGGMAVRGRIFALVALIIIFFIIFGFGWLNKLLGRDKK